MLPSIVVGATAGVRLAQFLQSFERLLPECGSTKEFLRRLAVHCLATQFRHSQPPTRQQIPRRACLAGLHDKSPGTQIEQPA